MYLCDWYTLISWPGQMEESAKNTFRIYFIYHVSLRPKASIISYSKFSVINFIKVIDIIEGMEKIIFNKKLNGIWTLLQLQWTRLLYSFTCAFVTNLFHSSTTQLARWVSSTQVKEIMNCTQQFQAVWFVGMVLNTWLMCSRVTLFPVAATILLTPVIIWDMCLLFHYLSVTLD